MSGEVEQWEKELLEAGWKPRNARRTEWIKPVTEAIFRGPYRAWVVMKENAEREKENRGSRFVEADFC